MMCNLPSGSEVPKCGMRRVLILGNVVMVSGRYLIFGLTVEIIEGCPGSQESRVEVGSPCHSHSLPAPTNTP